MKRLGFQSYSPQNWPLKLFKYFQRPTPLSIKPLNNIIFPPKNGGPHHNNNGNNKHEFM